MLSHNSLQQEYLKQCTIRLFMESIIFLRSIILIGIYVHKWVARSLSVSNYYQYDIYFSKMGPSIDFYFKFEPCLLSNIYTRVVIIIQPAWNIVRMHEESTQNALLVFHLLNVVVPQIIHVVCCCIITYPWVRPVLTSQVYFPMSCWIILHIFPWPQDFFHEGQGKEVC